MFGWGLWNLEVFCRFYKHLILRPAYLDNKCDFTIDQPTPGNYEVDKKASLLSLTRHGLHKGADYNSLTVIVYSSATFIEKNHAI